MPKQPAKKNILIMYAIFGIIFAFSASPVLGGILLIAGVSLFIKYPKLLSALLSADRPQIISALNATNEKSSSPALLGWQNLLAKKKITLPAVISTHFFGPARLEKRKKYLQIALNSTLEEAQKIISQLPASERILIEAGTPLIKIYGTEAVSRIKAAALPGSFIVADNKCADLAGREVEMMALSGANAATCLGVAPIETIDGFIEECRKFNIDSMLDMMNVENALAVLKKLKKLPDVVVLHRGVDESEFSKEKQIPYYQIKQIKGNYKLMVAVAGGDTIREVQRAIFNDADIVVVWKNFYQSGAETAQLAESFLKAVK